MITKITGKLLRLGDDNATLGIEAFEYQVFIADYARRNLASQLDQDVSLFTIYYMDGDPSRGRARLRCGPGRRARPRRCGSLGDR